MSEHLGILGALTETSELAEELGITFAEAAKVQRERSDERVREHEALERAKAESNVIPFRAKH